MGMDFPEDEWQTLCGHIKKLMPLVSGVKGDIKLSSTLGDVEKACIPSKAQEMFRLHIAPLLIRLEDAMPLCRPNDDFTHEILQLVIRRRGLDNLLLVINEVGQQEVVTFLTPYKSKILSVKDWCHTRRGTVTKETSWDRGREKRVVVPYGDWGKYLCLIDPGAVRLVEIANASGAKPWFSCEGHPQGAYLLFIDSGEGQFSKAMHSLKPDWYLDPLKKYPNRQIYRMRGVKNLADRDNIWRQTCAELECRLGLE
jgi:hypothetical protein